MDEYLEGPWEEFEEWIRNKIGSDFRWCVHPRDTTTNREMVGNLILNNIERCNGVSPGKNAFTEVVKDSNEWTEKIASC